MGRMPRILRTRCPIVGLERLISSGLECVDRQQSVLDRKQAGVDAARRTDLCVDVLDVIAGVFGEITSRPAISLLDSPRDTSRSTSTSRAVSPAGRSRRWPTGWPAASSTASTASPSSRPAPASRRNSAAAVSASRSARCGRGSRIA